MAVMAMASSLQTLQTQTQTQTQTLPAGHGSHIKLTKSRSRTVVRPILKKLHAQSHSHSERHSLDLDRGWDDQPMATPPDLEYASLDHGARDDRRRLSGSTYTAAPAAGAGKAAKLTRDVSFTLSATDLGSPGGGGGGGGFSSSSHARSTSRASVATTASSHNGFFVHPFQQIPRASTPPLLSYATSAASLDTTSLAGQQLDHSSSIAEREGGADDGDGDGDYGDDLLAESLSCLYYSSATATKKLHHPPHLNSNSRPHRPSFTTSQRTSLQSDGISLQVTATRPSSSAAVPRLTQCVVNHNRSDLQPSPVSSPNDSALSGAAAPPLNLFSRKSSSPSLCSSSSPMPPFRTSLDMNGFRIRSRSEIDTATRQEQVREARRKFEAKEREKDEKYAREQMRKRERADAREAQKYGRVQAHIRNGSMGNVGSLASERNSSSTPEKGGLGQTFNSGADDVHFHTPSRSRSAKHKTNGVWTAFVLWLRTRLLKMGRL